MSRQCQLWFRSNDIVHYTTTSKVKAPSVERSIRTIRTALHRYFELTGTFRWIDYLSEFVNYYNNRPHSTTGQRPWDVVSDPTLLIPHGHGGPPAHTKKNLELPPVGSFVRISRLRSPFEKEATGPWSREVFKVTAHKLGQAVPMLSLQDLTGEDISGNFYLDEVQSISWHGTKKIAQIHKLRENDGKTEILVSYEGWPENYMEWTASTTK